MIETGKKASYHITEHMRVYKDLKKSLIAQNRNVFCVCLYKTCFHMYLHSYCNGYLTAVKFLFPLATKKEYLSRAFCSLYLSLNMQLHPQLPQLSESIKGCMVLYLYPNKSWKSAGLVPVGVTPICREAASFCRES